MSQHVKGPMPIAVILCSFKDVPIPNYHPKYYHDFVSSSGRGGLFDYWRDVSYNNIDLSGSEVFGWFTMRYSFSLNCAKGVGQAEKTRSFWMKEGRRLAAENMIDLSRFRGVIIVVNAPVGTAWEGNTCLLDLNCWGQGGWKWCRRCHLLAYNGDGKIGKCLEGGEHDHPPWSPDYGLPVNEADPRGQPGWRKCRKCRCLFYGNRDPGKCPGGFSHDFYGSSNYSLSTIPIGISRGGWKWCCKCEGLVYPATTGSVCSAKGFHETRASSIYHLVQADSSFNATQGAHQTGHMLLGLSTHAMVGPDNDGEDCWDIMAGGFENRSSHDASHYRKAGPGLSAATLTKLGWVPEDRIFTFTKPNFGNIAAHHAELKLVPLNAPEKNGYLVARVASRDHVYTIELRKATHWDAGIGQTAVLIHELRSEYTTMTKGWRVCRLCHALTDVRTAVCPAGSFHDHSQSGNYKLPYKGPGDDGWHPCTKCQSLVHHTASPASCPADGIHHLDLSKNFTLTPSNSNAKGQPGWKRCSKCHVLSFTGHSGTKGACPGGGTHEHSGSPDYTLLHNIPDSAPADIEREDNWRWCRKCECLAYAGYPLCVSGGPHDLSGSMDYALKEASFRHPYRAHMACTKCFCVFRSGVVGCGPCASGGNHSADGTPLILAPTTASFESTNGQDGWKFCEKCHLLLHSPGSPGYCAAGGDHDVQKSSNYRIACFSMEKTYLIGTNWIGGGFVDRVRGIRIHVDEEPDEEGRVSIKLVWK